MKTSYLQLHPKDGRYQEAEGARKGIDGGREHKEAMPLSQCQ